MLNIKPHLQKHKIIVQSTTSTTEFFVVGQMSGILVGFGILVGTKTLEETTLHFDMDQFRLDLLLISHG